MRIRFELTGFHIVAASLCLAALLAKSQGATITAKSLSRPDVGAAVAGAADGDTVFLPAGVADWTNTLVISNAITLQGAGIGQTIILDDIATVSGMGRQEAVLALQTLRSSNTYRLTGIEIDRGTNRVAELASGAVQIAGTSQNVRIDHCKWQDVLNNRCLYWFNWTVGVVDHCIFALGEPAQGQSQAIAVFHDTWGNGDHGHGSFAALTRLGQRSSALYVEDNIFYRTQPGSHGPLIDSFAGARYVVRHNYITNCYCEAHGTESSGSYRGTRSVEIYSNYMTDDSGVATAVNLRSGTGVIWSNTCVGYSVLCTLVNYRNTYSVPFWGGADGTNSWDFNDPAGIIAAGTHTGTNASIVLTDANASWAINQWRGYTLRNTASLKFSLIYSNSVNSLFTLRDPGGNYPVFNNGQPYEIRRVLKAIDMPGMGQSDLLSGNPTTGAPGPVAWPHQLDEPVYQWNNSMSSGLNAFTTDYGLIQPGTNFVNDASRPDYFPLPYPYSLPNPLLPPVNLRPLAGP